MPPHHSPVPLGKIGASAEVLAGSPYQPTRPTDALILTQDDLLGDPCSSACLDQVGRLSVSGSSAKQLILNFRDIRICFDRIRLREANVRRELSLREIPARLDDGMERHVFRVSPKNSSIPGTDLASKTNWEVAFIAKEIAGQTWATTRPWTAYLTRKHHIVLWDDNGGLMVFSSFDELRSSAWSDSRVDVGAEVAAALGKKYVIDLDP
jgi:hypothetical protein